ncbi:MAG: hypothetical protein KatS3mg104_2942 [Phycisphaerae bacterium]|nr:MAG: hypothetical protein KatS3mg104_2942 [Phycisphaerae bacterium]
MNYIKYNYRRNGFRIVVAVIPKKVNDDGIYVTMVQCEKYNIKAGFKDFYSEMYIEKMF